MSASCLAAAVVRRTFCTNLDSNYSSRQYARTTYRGVLSSVSLSIDNGHGRSTLSQRREL